MNTECYLQYLPELPQQPDKNKTKRGNHNFQRASWHLHKIKKAYIQHVLNQLVKIL